MNDDDDDDDDIGQQTYVFTHASRIRAGVLLYRSRISKANKECEEGQCCELPCWRGILTRLRETTNRLMCVSACVCTCCR